MVISNTEVDVYLGSQSVKFKCCGFKTFFIYDSFLTSKIIQ